MTFENRKRLAKHFYELGVTNKDKKLKNHPYVLEMKRTKGDDPATIEVEEPIQEIQEDKEVESEEVIE